MRAEANKAVFLSYASQDAEAVRAIAEALRAAGVEVWFDQNELTGGDAWDAKIRKQIAECALFVPVISGATQARREGYFRLEWKLAAQRTHMIADGTPFLLPVVIDATRDAEALVPAEFRALQWTRLAGGEGSAAFCVRVKTLLAAEDADPVSAVSAAPHVASSRPRAHLRPWIFPTVLGLVAVAAVLVWRPWSKPDALATRPNPNPAGDGASSTKSALLLARARELFDTPTRARLEFETADQLCKQAVALDELSAATWALWSQVDAWLVYFNFDNSLQRRESARAKADKAIQLAPAAFESKLAQAAYVVLANQHNAAVSALSASIRESLRGLYRERPKDPQVLLILALLERNLGERETTRKLLAELATVPRYAGVAHTELGWAEQVFGEPTRADAAADRAVAAEAYWNSLILKSDLAAWWWGDLARAQAVFDRMPASALGEDAGASQAVWTAQARRDYTRMLDLLASTPREWLQSNFFEGPTGYLTAVAHAAAGRAEAAQQAAARARQLVEARLNEAPSRPQLLIWKFRLQVMLGELDEAKKTLLLFTQLNGDRGLRGERGYERAADYWLVGQQDTALAYLENLARRNGITWGYLATAAELEPMRGDARFQKLLATAKADPRLSPYASAGREAASSAVAEKSVAVLAFKNVGGDPANEAIVDGIGFELISVLGRVPGLTVRGNSSLAYFKGSDATAQEKGRKLDATYLVDGSVQRAGETVRINANLTRAATNEVVWSSPPLNRDIKNLFAVQDEIAGLIVQNLSLKLGASSAASIAAVKPEALELYVQARQAWNLRTDEGLALAEQLLTRALELEPEFARAHAAVADVWSLRGQRTDLVSAFGLRQGPTAARIAEKCELALKLDPQSAEAHASLGVHYWAVWRLAEGERALREAIRLNPNYASAHQWLGRALMLDGRLEEALVELKRATELDPLSPRILDNYAWALIFAGRFTEAIRFCDRALSLQATAVQPRALKGVALAQAGRFEEATELARVLPVSDSGYTMFRAIVLGLAGENVEVEGALAGYTEGNHISKVAGLAALKRYEDALNAIEPSWMVSARADFLLFHPVFDPMRGDARFKRMIESLGLAEAHARAQAWRAAHPPEKPAR